MEQELRKELNIDGKAPIIMDNKQTVNNINSGGGGGGVSLAVASAGVYDTALEWYFRQQLA